MLTIPTLLTLFRLALIPLIVVVFYFPFTNSHYYVAGIFMVAGFTDWLDGFLARVLNQTSRFGAFLDPVADKVIVVVCLILLTEVYSAWWFTLPVIVIIGREVVVSAIRQWGSEAGVGHTILEVSWLGKVKTASQMLSIVFLFVFIHNQAWNWTGIVLIYIATFLTLWSMISYLNSIWTLLIKE